jgi:hypothetical protein
MRDIPRSVNSAQKYVVIAAAVIAIMLLYPPWHFPTLEIMIDELHTAFRDTSGGYAFLLSPPDETAAVDARRLAAQIAVVAVLASGAFVALSRKSGS